MSSILRKSILLTVLVALSGAAPVSRADFPSGDAAPGSGSTTLAGCTGQADGTTCNDGNVCTLGEACSGGSCLPPASFTQPAGSPVAVGTNPFSVAVGDWDGDGTRDLALANNASNDVTILLGNGAGGFIQAAGSPILVGSAPSSVAAGDLDGDGALDLAVANYGTNDVTILKGNGSGGFSQAAGSPISVGTGPQFVAVGNWDGDADLDLAVANFGSGNVTIYLGNGPGTFTQASGSPIAAGTQPVAVASGDLDGDGDLDLAVADYGSNDVTLLKGDGLGGFALPTLVGVGSNQLFVALTDLDGDGDLDLAAALYNANAVEIQLGNGAGTYVQKAGSPFAVGLNPFSIAVGDLNGDTKPDLAVANSTSGHVSILLGGGTGGFGQAAGSPIATGPNPLSIVAGDWNGDGKLDLAVGNRGGNNVTILLNGTTFAADGTACSDGNVCTVGNTCLAGICLPPVTFTQPGGSPVAVGTSPFSMTVGDWDGDGKRDLAIANSVSNDVSILKGNGAGGFTLLGSPVVGNTPSSVATGDFDGDNDLDLAVANYASGTVTILLGNGAGAFTQATNGSPYLVGTGPQYVAVAEMTGDGLPDLAVANYGSSSVTILKGTGAGAFTPASGSPFTVGIQPVALAIGNLTPDNTPDLAVANYGSNTVTILKGLGLGAFTPLGPPIQVASPFYVAIRNLTADNALDLAVANYASNSVTILKGDGLGAFTTVGSPLGVGVNPFSIAAGDLNGDTKLDLAVMNSTSAQVSLLLGDGSGRFRQAVSSPIATGPNPISVVAGDWNGDGKLDLAAANRGSDSVTILLNNTATDGTVCDDGDICTQTDLCMAWTCTGSDVIGCDPDSCHPGGTCIPHVGCPFYSNGWPCDDGNANTCPDGCQDGFCTGINKQEPPEVEDLRVSRNGGAAVLTWHLAEGATSSAVLRGALGGLPVGSLAGDEDCLAVGLPDTLWIDSDVPESGGGVWYLIRGDCICREGSYGFARQNGVPTVEEVSTTCP